jgi:hypothetical protein
VALYSAPRRATALELVSSNSESDLKQRQALVEVCFALRAMTANLMRLARGTGAAYEIGPQLDRVIQALIGYRDVVGTYPTSFELSEALLVRRELPVGTEWASDRRREHNAIECMVRGALQIAASRLAGQRTHESRGESELRNGFYALEALRAEWRRPPATEEPRELPPAATRRKKPKGPQ